MSETLQSTGSLDEEMDLHLIDPLENVIPPFDETVDHIADLKNFVDWNILTKQQKFIVYWRSRLTTYEGIQEEWCKCTEGFISKEAIATAIRRASHSLPWIQGMSGGSDPYLPPVDMQTLKETARSRAYMTDALDTITVRDLALRLKKERQQDAISFLKRLHCFSMADEEEKTIYDEPSRTWINKRIAEIDVNLDFAVLLDGSRFNACKEEHVMSFFEKYGDLIRSTPPNLVFVADETMIDTTRLNKILKPSQMKKYLSSKLPDIPHATAMCCNNITGKALPLFIIMKGRARFPPELEKYVETLSFALCSTRSGWMDRWSFLYWTLCFIGWVTEYVDHLPHKYSGRSIILIVDGHTSRSCPIALELLRAYNIILLTLPGHATHIMQLFDVGLGHPLKKEYTNLLKEYIRDGFGKIPGNESPTLTRVVILAMIQAWNKVSSIKNILAAAEAVGLNPYCPDKLKESSFIKETFTPEEERIIARRASRRTINNMNLTTAESITDVRTNFVKEGADSLLCKSLSDFHSLRELVAFYAVKSKEQYVNMLTTPPLIRGVHFYGLFGQF